LTPERSGNEVKITIEIDYGVTTLKHTFRDLEKAIEWLKSNMED
jgi:hypothetical protein